MHAACMRPCLNLFPPLKQFSQEGSHRAYTPLIMAHSGTEASDRGSLIDFTIPPLLVQSLQSCYRCHRNLPTAGCRCRNRSTSMCKHRLRQPNTNPLIFFVLDAVLTCNDEPLMDSKYRNTCSACYHGSSPQKDNGHSSVGAASFAQRYTWYQRGSLPQ